MRRWHSRFTCLYPSCATPYRCVLCSVYCLACYGAGTHAAATPASRASQLLQVPPGVTVGDAAAHACNSIIGWAPQSCLDAVSRLSFAFETWGCLHWSLTLPVGAHAVVSQLGVQIQKARYEGLAQWRTADAELALMPPRYAAVARELEAQLQAGGHMVRRGHMGRSVEGVRCAPCQPWITC